MMGSRCVRRRAIWWTFVLPPGSEAALFIGSTLGNPYEATLPTAGVYAVRLDLRRSAAR